MRLEGRPHPLIKSIGEVKGILAKKKAEEETAVVIDTSDLVDQDPNTESLKESLFAPSKKSSNKRS